MSEIRGEDRHQQQIFSSLEDQVERESLVRILDAIVDTISREKEKRQKGSRVGRPEYPESSMLKLYIYGYMQKIKSSRKLERECKVNLEVMWLMKKLKPDHWTISNFRKEKKEEIKEAIKLFTKFLKESGYIEGKTIVIDGTKIKANASVFGNMNKEEILERIGKTEEKITHYIETMEQDEDQTELIEKLQKEKEELMEQIEKLKADNKKVYVKTDPDANIIRKQPAYNVQISCDKKNKLIIATDISCQTNDSLQLRNMYNKSVEILEGTKPEEVIADSGYSSPDVIEALEKEEKVKTYIATLPPQGKGNFVYDEVKDEYMCPEGKILKYEEQAKDVHGHKSRKYRCKECEGCPIRTECTKSKYGRTKMRYLNQEYRDSYREKMETQHARDKMKTRRTIVEHPFATIKLWLGRNPLLLRGLEKVQTEIRLVCFSYNLLRIYNIDGFDTLLKKINDFNWEIA